MYIASRRRAKESLNDMDTRARRSGGRRGAPPRGARTPPPAAPSAASRLIVSFTSESCCSSCSVSCCSCGKPDEAAAALLHALHALSCTSFESISFSSRRAFARVSERLEELMSFASARCRLPQMCSSSYHDRWPRCEAEWLLSVSLSECRGAPQSALCTHGRETGTDIESDVYLSGTNHMLRSLTVAVRARTDRTSGSAFATNQTKCFTRHVWRLDFALWFAESHIIHMSHLRYS